MLGDIKVTKDQAGDQKDLNRRNDLSINRGIELMLRNYKKEEKPSEPKTFEFCFGKMLSLLNREMHFRIELSFDYRKSKSREKKRC